MDDESEILGYEDSWEDAGNGDLDYDDEQRLLGEDEGESEHLGEEQYEELQEDEGDILEVSGIEFEEADTSVAEQQEKTEPSSSAGAPETTTTALKDHCPPAPKQIQQRPQNPYNHNRQPARGGHFSRFPRPTHNIRHMQERPPHFGFRSGPPLSKRLFINPHYRGRVAVQGNQLTPTSQLGPCFLQPMPRFRSRLEGPGLHVLAPSCNIPRSGALMPTPINVPPPPMANNQQPRIPSLMDLRPHPPNFSRPPPPITRFPPPGLLSPPNFIRNPPPHVVVPPFRQNLQPRSAHERTVRELAPAKRTEKPQTKEESAADSPFKKIKLEDVQASDGGTAAATKSGDQAPNELVDQDYLKKMEEQKRKREEILKMKELRRKEKFAAANNGDMMSSGADSHLNGNEDQTRRAPLPQSSTGENRIATVLTSSRPSFSMPPVAVPVRHQQPRQPVPRHAVPPLRMTRPLVQSLFQGPPPPLPGSLAGLPQHMNGLPALMPEPQFPSDTLSIENLGKGSTEAQVMVLCGQWGPIQDLYLKPMERKAVVKFPSIQAAVVFRQTHNGASVNGSILRVNFL